MVNLPKYSHGYSTARRTENGRGFFYTIRDRFWEYPRLFLPFFEKTFTNIRKLYKDLRPLSPILLTTLSLIAIVFAIDKAYQSTTFSKRNQIIEGVLGSPDNLNPAYIPALQVQKDVFFLTYEPLFRVNLDGTIEGVLAESWEFKDDNKKLLINLRENVHWHDGEILDAEDLQFTLELYKSLQGQNSYFDTVENVEIEVLSENSAELTLEQSSASFLETITWPVLPKHILEGISVNDLENMDFKNELIGTGPYKLSAWRSDTIRLSVNEEYWGDLPEVRTILFRSYTSEVKLENALLTGKIDSTAELTVNSVDRVSNYSWINLNEIPLYRRMWSVYSNFRGPESLQNKQVRQAISEAIDREKIISEVFRGYAEAADSPIQKISWAYNADAQKHTYNVEGANTLLNDAGYSLAEGAEYRTKDDVVLELELAYVSNPIQDLVAERIAEDLKTVGIKINLTALTYKEFRDTRLIPRNFDLILFGIEMLLDPDHFILWHSSQVDAPGRNFSSYKSSYTVIGDINRVDDLLEKGRATFDQDKRKEHYDRFQVYVLDEAPAAFLYHPSFIYTSNKRVANIDLSNTTLPEERFRNIANWQIQ